MSQKYQSDGRSLEHSPVIEEDIQRQILKLAGDGEPIQRICKIIGLSWDTIARYIKRDPLFELEWQKARVIGADLVADELYTIYDNAETMVEAVVARGKSENIKTIAGWRNASKYGPKVNVEVTHSIDLSKALQQAEHRTIPILEQAQLERENEVIHTVREVDVTLQHNQYIQHVTDQRQNSPHVGKSVDKVERDALKERARRQAEADKAITVEVQADHDFERFL